MQLQFTKIHGAGNDFIVIDDLSNEIELEPNQVAQLCDRHFGIGADGIILVRPSGNADCVAYMHYINADGTLAEMCGNGIRCFAKYLVDKGFVPVVANSRSGSFVADTKAGRRFVNFVVDDNGLLTEATVDMGEPTFNTQSLKLLLDTGLGLLTFYDISMGNPHAVTFCGSGENATPAVWDMDGGSFAALGAPLESNTKVFPNKSNIEFAEIISDKNDDALAYTDIRMRVYERGVGETLACGTGACATAVAASLSGRAKRRSKLHLKGGVLDIFWDENNNRVSMTGPATTVFEGSLFL
ncbi:MAG: diaminopimelate epimerase [Coriobacteriales bacterium]|nr:diaminopimelate epimerase [Coriobacteriales bacterium]